MASRYERSLRNPLRRPLVGVPTHTPIRTKKISYRATAVVDVASYAAETKILWMPHAGCAEDVDVFRVVGGSISSGTNRTNSRFTASQFGDGLRARLVSARLTVCGCSAEDNGVIVAGTSVNEDISGYDAADLMSRISEKHLVIARTVEDEVHINYVPGSDDERVAFLDDVSRGPYEGLRDITSEAYPARHVATWKGTSVDSEIVSVPYTYTYDTKDLVYGDVDLPFTYSYNDPILYYPWGIVQVPNDANTSVDLSFDYGLQPIQLNGVDTVVFSSATSANVNGLYGSNKLESRYTMVNSSVPVGYTNTVNFCLHVACFRFRVSRRESANDLLAYMMPKKLTLKLYNDADNTVTSEDVHISHSTASQLYSTIPGLYSEVIHDVCFSLQDERPNKIKQVDVYCDTWWDPRDFSFPGDGSSNYRYRAEESNFQIDPVNTFTDGTCVHKVDNFVTGTGTVTNNQVTQVNESTVSETVNVPYEVIHGRQQLLVEVHTNWEFIGTVMDGSETLTPSAVVTIGDGLTSDVFTTPRNSIEKRKRFDDTAEGFVGSRERASRRKKLEMIEEDAYESP